jgi:hypothetical protein
MKPDSAFFIDQPQMVSRQNENSNAFCCATRYQEEMLRDSITKNE